jgi:hypothetical protein
MSAAFDQMWNQKKASSDTVSIMQAQVATGINSAILQQDPGAKIVSSSFPAKGTLKAWVAPLSAPSGLADSLPPGVVANPLWLVYRVPGISTAFQEGKTGVTLTLTFDLELVQAIAFPEDPTSVAIGEMIPPKSGWHEGTTFLPALVPQGLWAEVWARNVKLHFDGIAAQTVKGLKDAGNWINGQPSNDDPPSDVSYVSAPQLFWDPLFQNIDMTYKRATKKDLDFTWPNFFAGFRSAYEAGFRLLRPRVENGVVYLDLFYSGGAQPVVWLDRNYDPAYATKNVLSGPLLTTSRLEVKAGGQMTVNGMYFLPAQAHQLLIHWGPTAGGTTKLMYGPVGKTTTVPLDDRKTKGTFLATGLTPNQTYVFQVQCFDRFTCSPVSNPLYVKTAPSDEVTLYLNDGPRHKTIVGHATLGDGTFTTTVNVPARLRPGQYMLWAQAPKGQTAGITIKVVGANQNLQPMLAVIDPSTNAFLQGPKVVEGDKVSLHGEGFAPGQVTLYIDSDKGRRLGAATADASGAFTTSLPWPAVYNSHKIVAYEAVNGHKLQASASVYGQSPLH